MLLSEFLDAVQFGGGTNMVDDLTQEDPRAEDFLGANPDDFERSACPACGDPDCTFPPECRDAIGEWPEPVYGEE